MYLWIVDTFIYYLPSFQCDLQLQNAYTYRKTNSIEHAHVRNVDYDTKKKHILVSM